MKLKLKTKKIPTTKAGKLLGLCCLGELPAMRSTYWKNVHRMASE